MLAQLPSLVCQLLAFDSHLLVRLNDCAAPEAGVMVTLPVTAWLADQLLYVPSKSHSLPSAHVEGAVAVQTVVMWPEAPASSSSSASSSAAPPRRRGSVSLTSPLMPARPWPSRPRKAAPGAGQRASGRSRAPGRAERAPALTVTRLDKFGQGITRVPNAQPPPWRLAAVPAARRRI